MKNITVQKVTLNNIKQLQEIGRKTFYETLTALTKFIELKGYIDYQKHNARSTLKGVF